MIANYHTHTYRCNHATGDEIEYVEMALQQGLRILGFSDHTPQWYGDNYYSKIRMLPQELNDYCDCVRALQKKYADRLEIHLGVEVEYYPALFGTLLENLREAGIEYLLLGQHWLGNEIGESYTGRATDSEQMLCRYCEQVSEAMETGKFTYFAHPDLIYYTGPDSTYRHYMRTLCQQAKRCNVPLEYNLLGYDNGRNYPDFRFWELAAEEGCSVILGSDAHRPEDVTRPEAEENALQLLKRLQLTPLDTVPLRKL